MTWNEKIAIGMKLMQEGCSDAPLDGSLCKTSCPFYDICFHSDIIEPSWWDGGMHVLRTVRIEEE